MEVAKAPCTAKAVTLPAGMPMGLATKTAASIAAALLAFLLGSCDRPAASQTDKNEDLPGSSEATATEPSPTADDDDQLALETLDQRASYSIGYRFGSNLVRDDSVGVDTAAVMTGMEDALLKRKQRLDDQAMRSIGEELDKRQETKSMAISANKRQEAREFLDRNGRRDGVSQTNTGLQFEILNAPPTRDDPSQPLRHPSAMDEVTVHYHGTLTNGTVFDSSIDRGEPITFEVRGVIPGWIEARQLMQVGEKRRLFIPPGLGYGSEGAGSVPPNSVLIFDLELLGIKDKEEEGP